MTSVSRSRYAVLGALAVLAAPACIAQAPPDPGAVPGPAKRPGDSGKLSAPAPQLAAMYLDHKLFTPDKWWSYEGADVGRPRARYMVYAVAQMGTASFTRTMPVSRGAYVKYTARDMGTPAKAKTYLELMSSRLRPEKHASLAKRVLKAPGCSKGLEAVQRLVGPGTEVSEYATTALLQYGRYVIVVEQRANMKALGPKPASGTRRWMSEAVYAAVLSRVTDKWSKPKIAALAK